MYALSSWATSHPQQPAVIFDDGEEVVSFADLEQRSRRLAVALRRLGLRPGEMRRDLVNAGAAGPGERRPPRRRLGAAAWLCAAALAAAGVGQAADSSPTVLEIDPARTRVAFTLNATLHTVEGSFQLRSGVVRLDPATGEAQGLIVVDAASGASGNGRRDATMRDRVLEAGRHPEIRFVPAHFELGEAPSPDEDLRLRIHGSLALHGAEHEVAIDVRAHTTGDEATFTARFTVPYVAWGLEDPSFLLLRVDKTVEIEAAGAGRIHRGGQP